MKVLMVLAAALLAAPGVGRADDAATAAYLCAIINATGLTNTQCDMSTASSSVTSTIEISAAEADKLCEKLVELMAQRGRPFSKHWVLNIRSPYNGKNRIAFCDLPTKAASGPKAPSH